MEHCSFSFGPPRSVLIVDDDPMLREILTRIVKKTPHRIHEAEHGKAALTILEQEHIDLVLLDLRMPIMGGREFLAEASRKGLEPSVIVLTGHGDFTDAVELLSAHKIFDFIQKPLQNPFRLIFAIENALEKRRIEREIQQRNTDLLLANQALEREVAQRIKAEEALKTEKERVAYLLSQSQKVGSKLKSVNDRLVHQRSVLVNQKNQITNQSQALAQGHKELQRKTEQLINANKHKSVFLAAMSHKFRTPLNGLINLTRVLMENHEANLSGDYRRELSTILSCGEDLQNMLESIVTLCQVEGGSLTEALQPLESRSFVDGVVAAFQSTAEERGLSLSGFCHDSVPPVLVMDGQKLKLIARHLVGNALNFTESGEVKVALSTVPEKSLLLTVTDTGRGISEVDCERLFEPFHPIEDLDPEGHLRLGLGLAICQGLVDAVGGEISVKSHPGKGSEFKVVMPFHFEEEWMADSVAGEAATPLREEQSAFYSSTGSSTNGNALLLFDPDLPRGFNLANAMEKNGFRMVIADDMKLALDKLSEQAIWDGVLLNLDSQTDVQLISPLCEAARARDLLLFGVYDQEPVPSVEYPGMVLFQRDRLTEGIANQLEKISLHLS